MSGGAGLTKAETMLTARSVAALRKAAKPYRVKDGRCLGLAVRVATTGSKTWDLAFRIKGTGKVRRTSLGSTDDVCLEEARIRANAITAAARSGRDLIAEEKATIKLRTTRISVEQLIAIYVLRRVNGRLRSAKEIESRLRRALAPILSQPAADVQRRDIRELLNLVADAHLQREAEKRRQTVGAMFRWALSEDLVERDPTAGLKAYDPGTPRNRILTDEEVYQLWNNLDKADFPAGHTDIIRLELLTGARCSEVGGLCAEEVDRTSWIWRLPAERSKNGRARLTPLVGKAREIVAARLLVRPTGPLFTTETGTPVDSANMGKSLQFRRERLGLAHFTTHDLRRTAATRMVELVGAYEIVAAVIGQEGGARETRTLIKHYVRTDFLDRKRHVLEVWDRRVEEIVGGMNASNVTNLFAEGQNAAKPQAAVRVTA
ncbi:MAG: tyrosine-type recombinase/integrase [Pseudolabrys sp.]